MLEKIVCKQFPVRGIIYVCIITPSGQEAEFHCMVDGDPAPTVEWSKGKWMKITAGPKFEVYKDQATGENILKMKKMTTKDAGTYTVTASNEHGTTNAPASLMITTQAEEVVDFKAGLKKRLVLLYQNKLSAFYQLDIFTRTFF